MSNLVLLELVDISGLDFRFLYIINNLNKRRIMFLVQKFFVSY